MITQLLRFCIDNRRFAVRAAGVREVLRTVALSPSLDDTGQLEGFLNLRGQTVPVVNLRKALGVTEKPMALTDALIVIDQGNASWALRADGGLTIHDVPTQSIQQSAESVLAPECVNLDDAPTFILDPKILFHRLGAAVPRSGDGSISGNSSGGVSG